MGHPIVSSFIDLIAWQENILLVNKVFSGTDDLPTEELYCFTSQIGRSALSIPANIKEGWGKGTP